MALRKITIQTTYIKEKKIEIEIPDGLNAAEVEEFLEPHVDEAAEAVSDEPEDFQWQSAVVLDGDKTIAEYS